MAARIRRIFQNEKTRAKIKSGLLINALSNHVLGENKMLNSQVRAADILLKKTIPDLSQVNGPGDDGEHVLKVIHESR